MEKKTHHNGQAKKGANGGTCQVGVRDLTQRTAGGPRALSPNRGREHGKNQANLLHRVLGIARM